MSRRHSGTITIHLSAEGRRRGAAVSAGEVVLNHVRAMEEDPEMNLYRIGDTTLNMDRVNGIQNHQAHSDHSIVESLDVCDDAVGALAAILAPAPGATGPMT